MAGEDHDDAGAASQSLRAMTPDRKEFRPQTPRTHGRTESLVKTFLERARGTRGLADWLSEEQITLECLAATHKSAS